MRRPAAGNADVAGHHRQRGHGAERRVGMVHALHPLAHADARGLRFDVLPGQALDHARIDAADFAGALERVRGARVDEVVEGRAACHAVHRERAGQRGLDASALDGGRIGSRNRRARQLVPDHERAGVRARFSLRGRGGADGTFVGLRGPRRRGHHRAVHHAQVRAVVLADEVGGDRFLHKLVLGVQVVADDPIHHAQRQRRIGLRLDRDPLVGHGRRGALARVDDDDLRAVLARGHVIAQLGRVRVRHVASPHDEQLGVQVVARVVRAAMRAEHHGHAHGRAMVAHDSFDVPGGGPYGGGVAGRRLPRQLAQVARERVERSGLRVFGQHGVELLGDRVDGLVPGDALELARATLARAPHGVHDARVFVLQALDVAHGAQARVGVPRPSRHVARLHAHELAVAHRAAQMAARRAVHRAHRMHGLLAGGCRGLVGQRFGRAGTLHPKAQRRCDGYRPDALDERATGQLAVAHEVLGFACASMRLGRLHLTLLFLVFSDGPKGDRHLWGHSCGQAGRYAGFGTRSTHGSGSGTRLGCAPKQGLDPQHCGAGTGLVGQARS